MERVLIIDPDAMHAAELQDGMEAIGYDTTTFPDMRNALGAIKEGCLDLIVVVPRSSLSLPDALTSVGSALKDLVRPPEILFLLRWKPRGPAERLLGDRWSVQVLYER